MNYLRRWGWPVVIVVGALITQLMYGAGVVSPLRTIVSAAFILICPGMAYVRLLNLDEPYIRWILALVLSIVLTTIVGMVLIYSGLWAINSIVLGIIGITLAGVVLDIATWNYRARASANRSFEGR